MIQVIKSQSPPAPLVAKGIQDVARLQSIQANDPAACRVPKNTLLQPKDGIYNDKRVKRQLRADQHDKCCYCERKPNDNYGDVEHFRPKGGVQQISGGPIEKPGYYWLAYEWSNLYFACIFCNQRYKCNYFPLRNPAARARNHTDDLAAEQPYLLDPATDDPTRHLVFHQDTIVPLDDRGAHSIQAFGLNQPELTQRRAQHLKLLKLTQWVSALDMSHPLSEEAASFLRQFKFTLAEGRAEVALAQQEMRVAALASAEFAGMVRANFTHLPH
jgi:uncharacterized protein (TIGR02646 family)